MQKKITIILATLASVTLAGIAIFTAVRLYQLRQESVSPAAPESVPGAATSNCGASCAGGCTGGTICHQNKCINPMCKLNPGVCNPTKCTAIVSLGEADCRISQSRCAEGTCNQQTGICESGTSTSPSPTLVANALSSPTSSPSQTSTSKPTSTPTQSPKSSPTATPSSKKTATPSPKVTLPESDGGTPVAGVATPTLALLFTGITFITTAVFTAKKSLE